MNIRINFKYTDIIWFVFILLLSINYSYANHNAKHNFYLDVVNGRLGKVKSYIEQGHEINDPIRFESTALMAASSRHQFKIVEYLIYKGADVNLGTNDNWTPLFYAANTGDKKIVELLLKHGAKAEIKDNKGQTPLSRVIKYDLMKLLIDHGAEVNIFNSSGYTPLMRASVRANIEFIKYLLEKGAKVNTKQQDKHRYSVGETAIRAAVKEHRTEVVKLLLDYGADPHIPDNDNITPVQWAKKRGYDDILKVFHDYNVLEPKKTASKK